MWGSLALSSAASMRQCPEQGKDCVPQPTGSCKMNLMLVYAKLLKWPDLYLFL